MSNAHVALIGLGLMGNGMARNLLAAGHTLTVYNRSRPKAEPLAAAGARIADSPRDAADGAGIVVAMVADDAASRSVWLREDGILAGAAPGVLFIESSTLSVPWVRELAAAAEEQGCELLDAPVTGSRLQAETGELRFLVGGSEAALDRGRPVLSAMGSEIVHVGPTGSGALLKLVNNFLAGVQIASLAEAFALIEKGGLDRDRALAVITGGAPGSPLIRTIAPRMAARDYSPHFALQLMAKDLTYASGEGEQHAVPMRMAAAALELFQTAIVAGRGGQDMSAVVEPLREA